MKKLFIVLVGAFYTLGAMEGPNPDLLVNNNTIWDIRVDYEQSGKELSREVARGSTVPIANPKAITKLKIGRSGMLGGLVPAKAQPDEVTKIQEQLKLYPKEKIVLEIGSPEGVTGSLESFIVTAFPAILKSIKEGKGLAEHFPIAREILKGAGGVKGMFGLRQPAIEAYNLLDFSENPTKEEIQAAYNKKRDELIQIAGGGYSYSAPDRARAEDALELVNLAHEVLTKKDVQVQKDKLQKLINERLRNPVKY